jgi:hypothetical protein
LVGGSLTHDVDDRRRRLKGLKWPHLSAHRADDEFRAFNCPQPGIYVRVCAVEDRDRREVDHPIGHVGMQIQGHANWNSRAHERAHASDDLAVRIAVAIGHGRAVQCKQHTVKWSSFPQS